MPERLRFSLDDDETALAAKARTVLAAAAAALRMEGAEGGGCGGGRGDVSVKEVKACIVGLTRGYLGPDDYEDDGWVAGWVLAMYVTQIGGYGASLI